MMRMQRLLPFLFKVLRFTFSYYTQPGIEEASTCYITLIRSCNWRLLVFSSNKIRNLIVTDILYHYYLYDLNNRLQSLLENIFLKINPCCFKDWEQWLRKEGRRKWGSGKTGSKTRRMFNEMYHVFALILIPQIKSFIGFVFAYFHFTNEEKQNREVE